MEVMDFVWLGTMVVAGVVEAAVPQLVSVWFIPGGLCALIVSILGGPIWAQALMFLGASVLALLLTRPLAKKWLDGKKVSTNADMVLGKKAVVTETIDNLLGTGRASVMGNSWSARAAAPEEKISAGEEVVVDKIEGVKLIVHRAVS